MLYWVGSLSTFLLENGKNRGRAQRAIFFLRATLFNQIWAYLLEITCGFFVRKHLNSKHASTQSKGAQCARGCPLRRHPLPAAVSTAALSVAALFDDALSYTAYLAAAAC